MGKMYIGTADGMKELKAGKEEPHGEQIFTESGVFTVPEGVYFISVFLIGGGWPGTFSASTYNKNPSWSVESGCGGNTVLVNNLSVKPGEKHSITVGAGGTSMYDPNDTVCKHIEHYVSTSESFDYWNYQTKSTLPGVSKFDMYSTSTDKTGSGQTYERYFGRLTTLFSPESGSQEMLPYAFGNICETLYSNPNYVSNPKQPSKYGDGGVCYQTYKAGGYNGQLAGDYYINNFFKTEYANGMQGAVIIRW